MKRILLNLAALMLVVAGTAQCTADYDFGDEGFGVSPNPTEGEQFAEGLLNEPYEDVLHVLVPTNGAELGDLVPEEFADLAAFIDIDSLALISVEVLLNDAYVDITDLGLEPLCNNNGDSPNPCHFLGGNQYCAALAGTPNTAGEFPMRVEIALYFDLFGETQEVPQTFEDYTLIINETSDSVSEIAQVEIGVSQNTPNPASGVTRIDYSLSQPSPVHFKVTNLLGEVVHEEHLAGRHGNNTVRFDASELNAGIYLYSVASGQAKTTKRMIVR
ncbi:MAG: T9SS type A sorting domain-containing protein [Flavobacteriales bacterium]